MRSICQLTASHTYHLYMEFVDMRKSFQGLQGLIHASFGRYLSGDEAFVFVGKNRTVKSYIVELRSIDTGIPIFLTSPEGNGRGKAIIQGYLSEWRGYGFMCDACASYDWLGKISGVRLCRCAAHARREMENALRENPTLSAEGLLLYQQIYSVEGMIRHEQLYADF